MRVMLLVGVDCNPTGFTVGSIVAFLELNGQKTVS